MNGQLNVVPARSARAVALDEGSVIEVVNTYGTQVIDTWALCLPGGEEWLSVEHTRAVLQRLRPQVGDTFVSNLRRPVLTLVEDSSPGVHDMLIPACDPERYRSLGADGYHDNCRDNFQSALARTGLSLSVMPSPLNLFMNVSWTDGGVLSFAQPTSRPGDHVSLRADVDLLLVMSACPQDMVPVNGVNQEPTEAHFRVIA